MKKVVLKYDENSGQIFDKNGLCITTYFGLEPIQDGSTDPTEKLCKLKESGFQVNEIMQLIREGMV